MDWEKEEEKEEGEREEEEEGEEEEEEAEEEGKATPPASNGVREAPVALRPRAMASLVAAETV